MTPVNNVSITADEQLAIVNAGSNNNVNGTSAGLNGIYPTSSTSLTTATDPSIINGFFTSTNYVGALNGPSDTGLPGLDLQLDLGRIRRLGARCTAVPAIGTYSATTSVCPTGTIDDGTNSSSSPAYRFCRIDNTITRPRRDAAKIAGVVYRLRGQTEVGTDLGSTGGTGVTLTIAPGVVIAADSTEATNDLLLVNRGSKISAVGTRDAPIIFTSQQNLASNGVSDATQGQWGGIILLGRAPTAVCATGTGPNNAAGSSTTCQLAIEGVTGRFYGGANTSDSSGQMSYVQIRYSGIAISDGNELQGLTLGGTVRARSWIISRATTRPMTASRFSAARRT